MSWWSGASKELTAQGDRVLVAVATQADVPAYKEAVRLSSARVGQWNPVNAGDLEWHLGRQTPEHRTFLIHALDPAGSHGIVGKVNVTNVVRGRFDSGTLGYDAYDPYAGRGLFAEGLRLIIGLALSPMPHGMGLHRVEANVRPGNERSAGLLRSLGFRREGTVRRMLRLDGPDGQAWRDHDMHALTIEEWPGAAYRPHQPERLAVLVNGLPGSGKSTLAAALAAELSIPLYSKDIVKETLHDYLPEALQVATTGRGGGGSPLGPGATQVLWALLAASPVGGVVESFFWPSDTPFVASGLRRAGFEPDLVGQVWCDVPAALARERYERRVTDGTRHPVHGDVVGAHGSWPSVLHDAAPPPVGRVLRVDTSEPVAAAEVTAIALRCKAITVGMPVAASDEHP